MTLKKNRVFLDGSAGTFVSPIGDVVTISGHAPRFGANCEVEAFIPHDLPDAVDLPGAPWMAVSDAAAELGRLDAAASLIPRPQLIARIATRRAAIGTSALEAPTHTSRTSSPLRRSPPEDQETEVLQTCGS